VGYSHATLFVADAAVFIGIKPIPSIKRVENAVLTLFYVFLARRMQHQPPKQIPAASPTQIPLWRQLQGAARLLMAGRDGQSMTAALLDVDTMLRPGVQALGFHALRWLGRAEALRQQLAKRPPPPEADALLCVALALAWNEKEAQYSPFVLVDQAVEAAKRSEATAHQASFINGCLRRFLRERDALVAKTDANPQAVWNHPQWWIDRVRKDHPEQWQGILRANNAKAPLVLRVNLKKTTIDQYKQALAAMNFESTQVGEQGLILASAVAVPSLPGYAEGHFSVQDAAAQLAAPLLLKALPAGGQLNIVRRHPDVRWLRRPTDIAQLGSIQAELLQTLWPLLKPGGALVYCTCSVFKAEGDQQIQTFLAHHTDVRLMPSPGHLLPQISVPGAVIPDNLIREHDGFYYALLQKNQKHST
jgi:16S rRNA C967 or C1407 C5-methylase (RsmB/RsmF family)